VDKIQRLIKDKIQRGEITKSKLVEEMEAVKAKITSIFGNMFNDALGGRQADIPSSALLGNSPEARRQRMLARLQKKQREKNSQ
jgi:soluble P-type ATPase